jgi:hypothetical protein
VARRTLGACRPGLIRLGRCWRVHRRQPSIVASTSSSGPKAQSGSRSSAATRRTWARGLQLRTTPGMSSTPKARRSAQPERRCLARRSPRRFEVGNDSASVLLGPCCRGNHSASTCSRRMSACPQCCASSRKTCRYTQ